MAQLLGFVPARLFLARRCISTSCCGGTGSPCFPPVISKTLQQGHGLPRVLTHKPCELSLGFLQPKHHLWGSPAPAPRQLLELRRRGLCWLAPLCIAVSAQIYGKRSQKATPGQNCLVLGDSSSLIRAIVFPLTPQRVPRSGRDLSTSCCW